MRLKEVAEVLMNSSNPAVQAIISNLPRNGGWRSLFDPFCAEWQDTDMEYKVNAIKLISSEVSLQSVVLAFQSDYEHRPDIADAAEWALCKLLTYSLSGKTEGE